MPTEDVINTGLKTMVLTTIIYIKGFRTIINQEGLMYGRINDDA